MAQDASATATVSTLSTRRAAFFMLAREREAIRRRRLAGEPWPWTDDPIFRAWRICNVHREHDRTTAWFREHVRSHLDGWRVVEATICFRWFNLIETGERIVDLLLDGWDRDEAYHRLAPVRDAGGQLWSGAYRLRGETGRDKLDTYLDAIERVRRQLPRPCRTVGAIAARCVARAPRVSSDGSIDGVRGGVGSPLDAGPRGRD